MAEFEFRDGVPYVVSKPSRGIVDESEPLPEFALRTLSWLNTRLGDDEEPAEAGSRTTDKQDG